MNDVQAVMEKLAKANKLMEDLIDMAMSDAEITEEEKKILFSINENLGAYAKKIMETVSDGKVDETEKASLKHLEEKIIRDAKEIASEDMKISDDEKRILKQLVDTIQSI